MASGGLQLGQKRKPQNQIALEVSYCSTTQNSPATRTRISAETGTVERGNGSLSTVLEIGLTPSFVGIT